MNTSPPRRSKKPPKNPAAAPHQEVRPPKWVEFSAQSLLDAAPDAMLLVNRAGEIVAANLQAQKLYGYSHEHLIARGVESLIPARLRDRHRRHRESFFANPEMQAMQVLQIFVLRSDATEIPVEVSLSRLTIGSETFAISAIRDVTQRVRAEELKRSETILRESEDRFRLVADTAPVLIWMSGTDKLCTYFNKPWLDFTGRSIDEELGNGWAEGVHPEDLQTCLDTYTQSFDRREKFRMEYRLRRHDGEYRWILDIGVPRFDQDRSFVGYIGIGVDVTERKQTEKDLRKSEERFHLAAQAGRMFAYEWDAATDVIVRSPESAQILGIDDTTLLTGQQVLAKVHPDDRERLVASVAELSPAKPQLHISYRMVRPDGTMIWIERQSRAQFDQQGKMLRIVGMVADITDRKVAEERLREYEKAVEGLEEMIVVVDREYRYLIANRKYLALRNMTKEQVVGRLVPEVLNKGAFEPVVKEKLDECFAGKIVNYEMSYTYPELGKRDLLLSYFPIEGAAGVDRVACILLDITERKRAEEALKKSEEKFSKAFRESPMALTLTSAKDHRYLDVNETFERITGWRRDEVIGRTPFDIGIWVDSTQRSEFVKRVLAEGAIRDCEVHFRSRDGTQRVGLGAGELIQIESEPCILSVIADITERKLAEEALSGMSRKLIEAQEQERTRVARELHDDIGQRLAMLAIDLERLQQNPVVLSAEARSRVEELQKRASELSTDIQSMSHELHSSKLEYLGIVAAMKSFTKEFGAQQNLEIDFQSHDLPSPVPADISLCLFRVLQEALHNSAKHSGVRRFAVRLWGTSDEIHLTVMDAGIGFNREAAKTGRGLGLVSMKERLKLVNGTLSIDTQPKRGTTIHARVPLISRGDSMHAAG
jgi:PAS domain S-box-containing protein